IGKNFLKTLLLTAKSKALTIKNLGKRMTGMNVEPYIVDVLTKDGRKIPFEINAEEKFKIITEQSLMGILIAQNNKIEYVNEEYAEIFGYSVDEVMKWNMKDAINAIHRDDREFVIGQLKKKQAGEQDTVLNYEYRGVKKNGDIIWIKKSSKSIEYKEGYADLVTILDITENKKAEEKFKALFDSSRDAIMTLTPPSWKFTSANPSTVELFKAKEESEFISKGPWEVSPEKQPNGKFSSDEAKKNIGNAMETGSSFFEWTHKTIDGKEFPTTVLLTRVEIEEGKPFLQATVRDITEQKKTEERLRESEERFRGISQNIGDFIWEVDKDGKYTFISGKIREILGYEVSEILGKTPFDLMPEDEAKRVNNILKEIVSEKKPIVDLEKINIAKDGRKICLLSNATPLLAEGGKLVGYRGVGKDITKRKQIEDEVRIRDKAISSSINAIVIANMAGEITYVNPSLLKMWKYNNEHELLGEPIIKLMGEKGMYMRIIDKVLDEGGWVGELPAERNDGSTFSIQLSMSLIRNDEGKPFRIMISVVDVSQQVEAEKSLKENEEKFRTFMETARDLMSITDKDGNFTDINKAMTRILGYSREEMIGMHITQILTKESLENDFKPNWEKLITNGEIGIETMFATKSGSNICGELKAVAIYDDDKRYVGGRVVIHDVTDRMKAEKEIMESQKKIKEQNVKLKKLDELKSAFLNITSHELRTPMSSIKGYVQLLIRQSLGNISKEQEKALKVVLRNTDRLDHLIQDILDISRLESGTMKFIPEKTDLRKMMNEVAETMKSSSELKKITISTDVEDDLPELVVDQDRIKQVAINFINNAIKFSPDGSIINLRAKKEGNDVLFEVQDFGRGIPKDTQEKVFETFYQVDSGMDRKFGGAGLGLAISRGIVIAHGGRIWVESKGKSGQGSSFKFALPIKSVKDVEDRFKKADVFKLQGNKRNVEKNDLESGMEE
ncbi:MAG: PAS domain S-box protein, partial [Candidatus Thermoplasmatota archaeon]|nr:PAS domain S-box protein [Candidatus Thermoplasmatota archaeon]